MSWLAVRPLALALALALDLVLGDPHYRMHPVRLLGAAIATGERALRRTPLPDRLAGALLALATLLLATGLALGLSMTVWRYGGPLAGLMIDAALTYFTLAGRALAQEGRAIAARIEADDLPGARISLAGIVGRDTDLLGESEIARATIETIAENSVDALIAPAFWALLLGPAGAWTHKAASTLDSMVGYRNERYERFGTAGARLDDALAWIPARLAIPLVVAASAVVGGDWRAAWATGMSDRLKHASPNSAHGEAAFAGALGVRLGGIVHYAGVPSARPLIGETYPVPRGLDVRAAVRLLVALEVLLLAMLGAAAVFGLL
jgi:adenosylcobinamide-phosphate synthase